MPPMTVTPNSRQRPAKWGINPTQLQAPGPQLWGTEMKTIVPFWECGGSPGPRDARRNERLMTARSGSLTWGTTIDGMGVKRNSGDDLQILVNSLGTTRSLLVRFTPWALPASTAWVWGLSSSTGASWAGIIGLRSTGVLEVYDVRGAAVTLAGGTATVGKPCTVVYSGLSGTGMRLFVDGALVNSNTSATALFNFGAGTLARIGAVTGNQPGSLDATVTLGAVWSRALTDAEAIMLTLDPYLLIRPRRQIVYGTGVGAGRRSFVPAMIG